MSIIHYQLTTNPSSPLSRYAKWLDKEGRRETFSETVERYMENVVSPKFDGRAKGDLEDWSGHPRP